MIERINFDKFPSTLQDLTMTLITNEIHILDGIRDSILVFAADRRISKLDGSFDDIHPKLFRIPYFDGGISYFGLAEVEFSSGRRLRMFEFLPAFINRQSNATDLKDFAFRLRTELNGSIPGSVLKTNASGFHICGYNAAGIPEFWSLMNIGRMDNFRYEDLDSKYKEPFPDFLKRDAVKLGWDGINPHSVSNAVQIYRNGDFRAHVIFWEKLDQMFAEMTEFPDFKKLAKIADVERWVKFKFEVIAKFYKEFAKDQIIGTPIDVFCTSR